MTRMKLLQGTVTAAILTALSVTAASADTFVTTGGGSNYNDPNSWSQNGSSPAARAPDYRDTVQVSHDLTVNVTSTTARVNIDGGKVLLIASGVTFTINPLANQDTTGRTSNINGELLIDNGTLITSSYNQDVLDVNSGGVITMMGNAPKMTLTVSGIDCVRLMHSSAKLVADADTNQFAEINGSGYFFGGASGATVRINENSGGTSALRLSGAKFHGQLNVQKGNGVAATFQNRGFVEADVASGVIRFLSSLSLSDNNDSVVRWKSSASGGSPSVLRFDQAASLGSNFDVNAGEIYINAAIATSRDIHFATGGQLRLISGASFSYGSKSGVTTSPTWPASPVTAANVYVGQ